MDPIPIELEHRLTFGDRVLWWGRPRRLAISGRRDLAALPVIAIAAATAAVIAFVPGPSWHPVVATIFRLAFASSGVFVIATHLAIVVRQRRRRFYAITWDRVLLGNDFWNGGYRAVPLERITDAKVDASASGDGTITLVVDDGTFPQLAHVAAPHDVRTALMAARRDLLARMPAQVPLEIVDALEPDERVLWWGRPRQGLVVQRRTLALLLWVPFFIALYAGAWRERSVVLTLLAVVMTLAALGLGFALASIDATLRFNRLYALTNRAALVLGWRWRQGRVTFRLPYTEQRYLPSVRVGRSGAGTIGFDPMTSGTTRSFFAEEPTATFDRIAGVKAVHAIYLDAARAAGSPCYPTPIPPP